MQESEVTTEIDRFREKLLDLSLRNPLLNYRKSTRRTLQIVDELPDPIFTRLVIDGKRFRFAPLADEDAGSTAHESNGESSSAASTTQRAKQTALPLLDSDSLPTQLADAPASQTETSSRHADDKLQTNVTEKRLDGLLNNIRREAATVIEETGVNYLYLAMGMLAWRESRDSGRTNYAPLLLIPIKIERYFDGRSNRYEYAMLWREEEVQDNLTLTKKLERDFGIRLPRYDEEQLPEQYFAAVQQGVCTEQGWTIERQALLGFFSFQKLLMYMDIDPANWKDNGGLSPDSVAAKVIWGQDSASVESDSANRLYASDYHIDDEPAAGKIVLATDADSSQHSALMDIAAGKNLVIEGPPGTGKSQTITNAIAHAIHDGKTILFVAEKLAALEVVHGKLARLSLSDFCLELHSDAASPRKVFDSLHQRLEASYRRPRELEAIREELQRKKELISDYLNACARPIGPYNEPIHQLLWRVVQQRGEGRTALRSAKCDCDISRITFEENSQLLEACAESMLEIKQPQKSPWWGFWPSRLNPNDCQPVADAVASLREVGADACRLTADLSQQFGEQLAQWIDSRLGQPILLTETSTLAENASDLIRSDGLQRFLTTDTRADARKLCELLDEVRQLEPQTTPLLRQDLKESSLSAAALRSLFDNQLLPLKSRFTWGSMKQIKAQLGSLRSVLEEVGTVTEEMAAQGLGNPRTLREYESAEFLCKMVRHPIVAQRTSLPRTLFYQSAPAILHDAHREGMGLLQHQERLNGIFHLDCVPEVDEVRDITKRLRAHATSWWRFVSGDYRAAKRKLAEFRRIGRGKTPRQWIAELEELLQWTSRCTTFVRDAECRAALGELFSGLETDWEQCRTLLNWVATAQKRCGLDHAAADRLLQQRNTDELRGSQASRARKLLRAELNSTELFAALGYSDTTDLAEIALDELHRRAIYLQEAIDQAQALSRSFSFRDDQSLHDIHRNCEMIQRYGFVVEQLEDRSKWIALGDWYAGTDTNGAVVMTAVDCVEQLVALELPYETEGAMLKERFPEHCRKLAESSAHAEKLRGAWETTRGALAQFGTLGDRWLTWQFAGEPAARNAQVLESLADRIDDLPMWSSLCRSLEQCNTSGLTSFTAAMLDGQIEPSELAATYRFTVLERLSESNVWSSDTLKNFSRKAMEKARARFQELDRELLTVNQMLVAYGASQRRAPGGISRGRVGEYTEMGLIRHEVQKQLRHCRIRDLLTRAGTSTQALKPCFMMSPLSVSQFLAFDGVQFDLVIMDEASQVKPEDAVGVLLRAKQIVVVGDPKQLPPTSFFDSASEDVADEDATQFDNTESILEVAMKSFQPVRRLRWHYRSQHESLIHFSNNRFYDGDLVVFPSPSGEQGNLGLRFRAVENGEFHDGCNRVEAETIARAIVEHARSRPHETLGVGTFNRKQSTLIQDWLDKLCEQDAIAREAVSQLNDNDRQEPIFIKNLETLQGDERDVMFISYTYGPDPASGRVMNRFGPINGEFGWRRLNVLVTRARRRVEVFSSMNPTDILGGPAKGRGVNAMKDYLEYSRTGTLPDRGVSSERAMESPFEEAVARVVMRLGLEVVPQVGVAGYFIDLGVRRPGESDFLLGIECDGAMYHSSRSARDRDRLREEVIVSRGWKLHRVWSTDWYMNQKHEEERLRQALIS